MDTNKVLILARKNLGGAMESSARLCLADAIALTITGDYEAAKRRALETDDVYRYTLACLLLAEAHVALGRIKMMHDWDFAGADAIRAALKAQGVELIDKPGGLTEWLRG